MEEQNIKQENTNTPAKQAEVYPVAQPEADGTGETKMPKEEKIKKRMSKWDKILIAIFAVILIFILYIVLDANKYSAMVHVVEGEGKVGINPTTEALDFGDLSRGTSAVRQVTIENGTFVPMYIAVFKTGEIGGLMEIDDNFFTLRPREDVQIDFSVYMPASAEIDATYKGRVFLFKIPWL